MLSPASAAPRLVILPRADTLQWWQIVVVAYLPATAAPLSTNASPAAYNPIVLSTPGPRGRRTAPLAPGLRLIVVVLVAAGAVAAGLAVRERGPVQAVARVDVGDEVGGVVFVEAAAACGGRGVGAGGVSTRGAVGRLVGGGGGGCSDGESGGVVSASGVVGG